MPTLQEVGSWRGQDLYDNDGDKIGEISDVYLDRQTEQPEWLAVKTGMFGTKVNFVPIEQASMGGDGVRVPFSKQQVKDAPNAEADGELSPEEERRLYDHYGQSWGDFDDTSTGVADQNMTTGRDRGDVSGPETDSAMTRSEEELRVGTAQRETGRARLRKHIVTENVETTVPVTREEVRVTREPITDANMGDAMSGGDLTEEEHEVTLTSEEAVVDKRVVPKERVRMDKEQVTEQQTVSETVRKEQIETEGDTGRGRDR